METTHQFRWVMPILMTWTFVFLSGSVRAEERRFVHPEDTMTYIEPASKSELRVVIDQHLGGTKDVTVADLVIPPGVDVPDHIHQSTEIFYVLSGELEQTSEGKVQKLTAGMACLVPANTPTHHKVTSKEPVHAVVIWAPGGEEQRIVEHWQKREPKAK